MKTMVLLGVMVLLFGGRRCLADLPTIANFKHNDSVQDSQTRTTYYVESDRRHVAAIDKSGSVLWCTEVVPAKFAGRMLVVKVTLDPKGQSLNIEIWRVGWGGGSIDTKTGIYKDYGSTL
jgi:hypothetical protein